MESELYELLTQVGANQFDRAGHHSPSPGQPSERCPHLVQVGLHCGEAVVHPVAFLPHVDLKQDTLGALPSCLWRVSFVVCEQL